MNTKSNIIYKSVKGQLIFQNIFRKSRKFSNAQASVYVVFGSHSLNPPEVNYAAIVKKKDVKKAVCRNRIKRLIRVSLRELLNAEKIDFIANLQYIIVIWALPLDKPGLLKLSEVKSVLSELIDKAILINQKFINKPVLNNATEATDTIN